MDGVEAEVEAEVGAMPAMVIGANRGELLGEAMVEAGDPRASDSDSDKPRAEHFGMAEEEDEDEGGDGSMVVVKVEVMGVTRWGQQENQNESGMQSTQG